MKFRIKKMISVGLLLLFVISISTFAYAIDDELPYSSYTYTRNGDYAASPAAYLTQNQVVIEGMDGTIANYPTDFMISQNGNFIISDNGNNRIICLDKAFNPIWEIKDIKSPTGTIQLNKPYSVAIDIKENIYIADEGIKDAQGNSQGLGRIIKLDKNRQLITVFERPVIKSFDSNYSYIPRKITVDESGRIYVIAQNINQGFIQLNAEGVFQGFLGAPKVVPDMLQLLLRLVSTQAQIDRGSMFVPTEYNSVDIDTNGFLYAITNTYNQTDMNALLYSQRSTGATSGQNEMIRRLNPSGADVMIRNGGFSPIGDLKIPNMNIPGSPILDRETTMGTDAVIGSSKFVDVKVIDEGIYFVLDGLRNRIFAYDYEGNMLLAFGSSGARSTSFITPVAIEYSQDNLYVLNSSNASISVCKPTIYGNKLISATRYQKKGEYEKAETLWNEILNLNSNCEHAYYALGLISLNKSEYKKSMELFEKSDSRTNYSKAFKYFRSEVIDRNFLFVILGIVIISIFLKYLLFLTKKIGKIKNKFGETIDKIRYSFYILIHPFDGFWDIKHEKRGNLSIAISYYFLAGITAVLFKNASSFIFNSNDPRYTNVFIDFASVILPYVLFIISNWCLTTLMDGKGTFKDITKYVGYSLLPFILANIISFILTYALSLEEAMLISIVQGVGIIWTLFLILAGTISTHDYSFKKSLVTLSCSIIGIVIVIFISLFLINIVQQITEFGKMIYEDLSIR